MLVALLLLQPTAAIESGAAILVDGGDVGITTAGRFGWRLGDFFVPDLAVSYAHWEPTRNSLSIVAVMPGVRAGFPAGWWTPWLDIHFGYARVHWDHVLFASDVDVDLFAFRIGAGVDFHLTERIRIGLDALLANDFRDTSGVLSWGQLGVELSVTR